jgi:hypothetical protein
MSSLERWQVKLGLILLWGITILTPLVIFPISLSYQAGVGWEMEPIYCFLIGAYSPPGGAEPSGWIIGPMYLLVIMTLLFFFIVYALQVSIYCTKPTARRNAIIYGTISLAIPFIISGVLVPFDAIISGVYVGPLPYQFILGLIVMWMVKSGKEVPEDKLLDGGSSWLEKNEHNQSVE